MTSFRLRLREPYRSVLPNNTCNNLPLGGGVSLRMIILTKQLVTAKSISLNAQLFKNLLKRRVSFIICRTCCKLNSQYSSAES